MRPNRASIACGIGSQFLIVPVASASAIAVLRANVEAHGRFEADGLHVRPAVDLLARFVALRIDGRGRRSAVLLRRGPSGRDHVSDQCVTAWWDEASALHKARAAMTVRRGVS